MIWTTVPYLSAILFCLVCSIRYARLVANATNERLRTLNPLNKVKIVRLASIILVTYFFVLWVFEIVAVLFALNHWYNGFIMTYNDTILAFLLFIYYSLNTRVKWFKWFSLVCFISIVIFYFTNDFYSPNAVLTSNQSLFYFSTIFMNSLFFATTELSNGSNSISKLNLRLSVLFLLTYFTANFFSVVVVAFGPKELFSINIILYLHLLIWSIFYLSCGYVLLIETKLIRNGKVNQQKI